MEPFEVAQRLQVYLAPHETLLWSGRPQQGFMLRRDDILTIPFSLVWAGAFVFGGSMAKQLRDFDPFAILFAVFAVYLLAGRFVVDALQRSKTLYAVTNERVLILSTLFGKSITSVNLRSLTDVTLRERSDGRGTIALGPSQSLWRPMNSGGRKKTSPELEGISNVRQVYEIIREAQVRAHAAG
jgi:hypothetical protein